MMGIPHIQEADSTGDIAWPWVGMFAPDPIEKLALHFDVLKSAAAYFIREGSKKYSFRARLTHEGAILHVIWEYKKNFGTCPSLAKVHLLLQAPDAVIGFDLIRAYDGLKITVGLPKQNLSVMRAIMRTVEILEYITSDSQKLLGSILDISR